MKNYKLLFTVMLSSLLTLQANAQTSASKQSLRNEIVSDLKGNILSFWENHDVDPSGGFYGSLTREGNPVPNAPKGGVLNARILWTFSTAYRMYGDEKYRVLADRAQRYFIDHFIDPEYGGTYWLLKADGTPQITDKQTYGCSYGIYGLSEHFRATGNVESLQKAIEIYQTMETKIKDPVKDGYIETFTRAWGKPQRLGYDGDGVATKTMNTHIHVLEAYTSLYRVWRDSGLRDRLAKIITLLTDKFYNPRTHHLILYFDNDWNSLNDIDSYGHDIETSWLLTEAAEVLGDPVLMEKAKQVALGLADASLKEGINPMGAMIYERNGQEYRRDASWWCQAETVVGCINAWQLTGKQRYFEAALRTWNFIKNYMVDTQYGEWFRTVMSDGKPNEKELKASMWNCPYHNSRMGFEIETRLK